LLLSYDSGEKEKMRIYSNCISKEKKTKKINASAKCKTISKKAKIGAWLPLQKGIIMQVWGDNRIEIEGGEKKRALNEIPHSHSPSPVLYAHLLSNNLSGFVL